MAMIALLYPMPLLLGAILLALGLYLKERVLRVAGDTILTIALLLLIYQAYMTVDYASRIEHGLFLDSWSDYLGFGGACACAGILVGDGLSQVLFKKSSSS